MNTTMMAIVVDSALDRECPEVDLNCINAFLDDLVTKWEKVED